MRGRVLGLAFLFWSAHVSGGDRDSARNPAEYWAEGVQSYFDADRESGPGHNGVNTREELERYDPDLARLVAEVFRRPAWRYRSPGSRGNGR